MAAGPESLTKEAKRLCVAHLLAFVGHCGRGMLAHGGLIKSISMRQGKNACQAVTTSDREGLRLQYPNPRGRHAHLMRSSQKLVVRCQDYAGEVSYNLATFSLDTPPCSPQPK